MDDWEAAASSWVPNAGSFRNEDTFDQVSSTEDIKADEPDVADVPAVISGPFNVKRLGKEAAMAKLGLSESGRGLRNPTTATGTEISSHPDDKAATDSTQTTSTIVSIPESRPPALETTKTGLFKKPNSKAVPDISKDWWMNISKIQVLGVVPVKKEAIGGGETTTATTEYEIQVTSGSQCWTVIHSHAAVREALEELSAEDEQVKSIGLTIARRRASYFSLRRYTGRLAIANKEAEAKALASIQKFTSILEADTKERCAWGFIQLFLHPYSRADSVTTLADGGAMGWLWKRGVVSTAWKRRFIAVCGRTLYYYIARLTQRQGHVRLEKIKDVTTTEADPSPDRPSRVVIQLHAPDRVWNLCSDDTAATLKWLDVFKSRIARAKKIVRKLSAKPSTT